MNTTMEKTKQKGKKKDRFWLKLIIVIGIALSVRFFVFEFIYISGDSMYPTLVNGQVITIWKVCYTPIRGDIIVFDIPGEKELVKRIIGLPGENIEIKNGIVLINGSELHQKYQYPSELSNSMPEQQIPGDSIFVLGDNRDHSADSRSYGPIKINVIRGKLLFALW